MLHGELSEGSASYDWRQDNEVDVSRSIKGAIIRLSNKTLFAASA